MRSPSFGVDRKEVDFHFFIPLNEFSLSFLHLRFVWLFFLLRARRFAKALQIAKGRKEKLKVQLPFIPVTQTFLFTLSPELFLQMKTKQKHNFFLSRSENKKKIICIKTSIKQWRESELDN